MVARGATSPTLSLVTPDANYRGIYGIAEEYRRAFSRILRLRGSESSGVRPSFRGVTRRDTTSQIPPRLRLVGSKPEEWLTKVELASLLKVSPRTIERLKPPAWRVGGQNRYRLSEVEAFLNGPNRAVPAVELQIPEEPAA